MLQNINTCENGWSNFSGNLLIVALKLLEFNSILMTKILLIDQFTLILYGLGVRCDVDTLKFTARAQSTNREV